MGGDGTRQQVPATDKLCDISLSVELSAADKLFTICLSVSEFTPPAIVLFQMKQTVDGKRGAERSESRGMRHSEDTRSATGGRCHGHPRFPAREGPHRPNCAACAIRCTGRQTRERGRATRRTIDCLITSHASRRRCGSYGARGGGGLVRNPYQCLVWQYARP